MSTSQWMASGGRKLPEAIVRCLRFSLAPLLVCFSLRTADAIVALPKGSSTPVMGYLVRQDERTIVIREELPGGTTRETPLARVDIDELIITVAAERLAALDPSKPELYREYAEELAEKRRDPEARDMAIRLYHMAAVLGDAKLRRGALLGLIALARSPDEERRLRAAAYLHDPDHDPSLLTGATDVTLPVSIGRSRSHTELLEVVRLARRGQGAQARGRLEQPAVRAQSATIAKIISMKDLLAACTARPLKDEQLAKLLRAELVLDRVESAASTSVRQRAEDRALWSQAAQAGSLRPLPELDLNTLTEFDPSASVFRSGKWVKP